MVKRIGRWRKIANMVEMANNTQRGNAMRTFAVRLNPDTRRQPWYSKYPTPHEYAAIYRKSPMDGFHEAVNYLNENGLIRGYLPPKHSKDMRTGEPFVLITVTAVGAEKNGDLITGIQAQCQYRAPRNGQGLKRMGGRNNAAKLTFHYSCPSRLTLLFNPPLPNARVRLLQRNQNWGQGPTIELTKKNVAELVIKQAIKERCVDRAAAIFVLGNLGGRPSTDPYGPDSAFDNTVRSLLGNKKKPKGNKSPKQKSIKTQAYERDPKVAAYALQKAKGHCGDCKKSAPFTCLATGKPFLEVHHIRTLKDGGSDTTDNVIALCPNCHRKRHYG